MTTLKAPGGAWYVSEGDLITVDYSEDGGEPKRMIGVVEKVIRADDGSIMSVNLADLKEVDDAPESAGVTLAPKVIVNGFPKAGTHLALLLVSQLCQRWQNSDEGDDWYFGTFAFNSFSDVWMPKRPTTWSALSQPPGTLLKAHCGHFPELEMAFDEFGTCMIFIYRDLRDVAVSMLYHINGDPVRFKHSERQLYEALPDDEARLIAIIEGIGQDPGLVRRWEYYAPWLDVDWVHAIRFEDVIADKRAAAHEAIQYCIGRTGKHHNLVATIDQADYDRMIASTMYLLDRPRKYSKTFRKGKAGGWREHFTPNVARAFDAAGGNDWLERLGYGN